MWDLYKKITIKFRHGTYQKDMVITTKYARCSTLESLELWQDLEEVEEIVDVPWIVVGGDFDVILDETE